MLTIQKNSGDVVQHLQTLAANTSQISANATDYQKYFGGISEQIEQIQKAAAGIKDEFSADREYLIAMAEAMRSVSDTLKDLETFGKESASTLLQAMVQRAPDISTKDLDDLFPKPATSVEVGPEQMHSKEGE